MSKIHSLFRPYEWRCNFEPKFTDKSIKNTIFFPKHFQKIKSTRNQSIKKKVDLLTYFNTPFRASFKSESCKKTTLKISFAI